MLRRKVTEVVTKGRAKHYTLKLECGHTVTRRDSGRRKPPQSTYCDDCVMILERIELAGDLVSAKEVKSTKATLRFLESEGYVESRRSIGTQTVYWKRVRTQ